MLVYMDLASVWVLGVACVAVPANVTRLATRRQPFGLSERYWRDFTVSLRLIGISVVIGVPLLLLANL